MTIKMTETMSVALKEAVSLKHLDESLVKGLNNHMEMLFAMFYEEMSEWTHEESTEYSKIWTEAMTTESHPKSTIEQGSIDDSSIPF